MTALTEEGRHVVAEAAIRHHVTQATVTQLLEALQRGNGYQAQFDIAELGGMGQWQGGMVMVGDMFNTDLKAKVDALRGDLSGALRGGALFAAEAAPGTSGQSGTGWPAELGRPASQGTQNDMRYAYFPEKRRLAVADHGRITVYDTADHQISGFGQAQGGGQSLSFFSQHGMVPLTSLTVVQPGP
jgi:hypothetical protein